MTIHSAPFRFASKWTLAKPFEGWHPFHMFRKTMLAVFSGFLVCTTPIVHGQSPDPAPPEDTEEKTPPEKTGDTPGPNRFWQATLEGGHYMIALDRISSVSRHKYVLDGAVVVDEVTVDSIGQALARFYYFTPITDAAGNSTTTQLANRGRELVDKAAGRANTEVQNMVIKKYPETTHAKTLEYRLLSESDLTSLYNSLRTSWESGKGRKFATGK
jgi:hypothetical protein